MTSYGEPRAIDPFPKHDSHNHDHYTVFLPALNPLKKKRYTTEEYRLLEDLAVSPWVLLASNNDWLLPGPLLVDELLVLRLGSIKLGELVALVVRGDIESWESFLATDDEGTLDDRVVLDTVDGSTAEDVLAGSLETSEKTADQVGSHENLGKLIVVLVVKLPERVLFRVVVLPEPLEGVWGIVVGVLSLPLVERESCLWQSLERVLWLWCCWSLFLFLLYLLGLWLGGRLLCSFLLWLLWLLWCLVLDGLIDELKLVDNSRVDWLVVDSLVPTGDVGVLRAPLLVKEVLETTGDDAGSEEISKSDTLTSQVGVVEKVFLDLAFGVS